MNVRRQIDRCESQRDLMDNLEPDRIGEINASLDEVRMALANNGQQLLPLLHQIAAIGDELAQSGASTERPPPLPPLPPTTIPEDASEVLNRAHVQKTLRDRERRAVACVCQLLNEQGSELAGLLSRLRDTTPLMFARAARRSPNKALVQQAHRTLTECTREVTQVLAVAAERIARALSEVEQAAAQLRLAHEQPDVDFRELVEPPGTVGGQSVEPSPREPPATDGCAKQTQLELLEQHVATLQAQRERLLVVQSELLDERFRVRCQVARQPPNRPCPSLARSLIPDLPSMAGP